MLITLSVWSVKYAPKKGLSATVGLTFPIIVFAFCGFDHSVANMLYFYYFGEVSLRVVGYITLSILGNIIGGVSLPLVVKLREFSVNRKKPKKEEEEEVTPLVDYNREIELRIQRHLGRKAKIQDKGKKKTLTLFYEDNEDLDELLKLLCGADFLEE